MERAPGSGEVRARQSSSEGSAFRAGEASNATAPSADDNPLYNTTEFRLFCFKVLPCSKRFVHDWTVCPFAHPGEKAKRRDPRIHSYTGVACPEMKKHMQCPRGDACPYAHNVFEYWMHPSRYRTQLCNDGLGCKRKVCFFAHSLEELRVSSVKVMPHEEMAGELDPFKPLGGQHPAHGRRSLQLPRNHTARVSHASNVPRLSFDAAAGHSAGHHHRQHPLLANSLNGSAGLPSPVGMLGAGGLPAGLLELQQLAALQALQAQMSGQAGLGAPAGSPSDAEQLLQLMSQLSLTNSAAAGIQSAGVAAAVSAAAAVAPDALSAPQLMEIVNMAVQQVLANNAAQQAAAALNLLQLQQQQQQELLLQQLLAAGLANGTFSMGGLAADQPQMPQPQAPPPPPPRRSNELSSGSQDSPSGSGTSSGSSSGCGYLTADAGHGRPQYPNGYVTVVEAAERQHLQALAALKATHGSGSPGASSNSSISQVQQPPPPPPPAQRHSFDVGAHASAAVGWRNSGGGLFPQLMGADNYPPSPLGNANSAPSPIRPVGRASLSVEAGGRGPSNLGMSPYGRLPMQPPGSWPSPPSLQSHAPGTQSPGGHAKQDRQNVARGSPASPGAKAAAPCTVAAGGGKDDAREGSRSSLESSCSEAPTVASERCGSENSSAQVSSAGVSARSVPPLTVLYDDDAPAHLPSDLMLEISAIPATKALEGVNSQSTRGGGVGHGQQLLEASMRFNIPARSITSPFLM